MKKKEVCLFFVCFFTYEGVLTVLQYSDRIIKWKKKTYLKTKAGFTNLHTKGRIIFYFPFLNEVIAQRWSRYLDGSMTSA